jgi:hypothetical protein
MELQLLSGNTVRINTKKTSIIVNDDSLDNKSSIKDDDIVISTNAAINNSDKKVRLFISSAGEYEVADVLIVGVPAFPYKEDDNKKLTSTIYKFVSDDTTLVVIGDIAPELSDSQVEALGQVDALIIPVGGNGLTLDSTQALKMIKKIDPFVVLPIHYDGSTKYSVEQDSLENINRVLGLEISETTSKYKLKSTNFIEGQATKMVVLEKN